MRGVAWRGGVRCRGSMSQYGRDGVSKGGKWKVEGNQPR